VQHAHNLDTIRNLAVEDHLTLHSKTANGTWQFWAYPTHAGNLSQLLALRLDALEPAFRLLDAAFAMNAHV
jgi:hypothetical protein